jgi:hypothetical protein
MALSSKAALVAPEPDFARTGSTRGIWKGDKVTVCFAGRKVLLKTEEPLVEGVLLDDTSCCDIIRVGDEFFVGVALGDHKQLMRQYKQIWGIPKKSAQPAQ